MTLDDLMRYAQALGDLARAARRSNPTVGFMKPDTYVKPLKKVLSFEIKSVDNSQDTTLHEHASAILVVSNYAPTSVMSSAYSTASWRTTSTSTPWVPRPCRVLHRINTPLRFLVKGPTALMVNPEGSV